MTSEVLSPLDSETVAQAEHPVDLAFWTSKITPFLIRFTQHLQSIPRINSDILAYEENHNGLPRPSRSHNADTTFELSERFITMLSDMCLKLPPSDGTRTADEPLMGSYSILDEASHLLIFSTYLRFLEMHATVFRYLQACLAHKDENAATESCFYLPKLVMGSFSMTTTSETRPLLYVKLMDSMLGRARNLFLRLIFVKASSKDTTSVECFSGSTPILDPTGALQAVRQERLPWQPWLSVLKQHCRDQDLPRVRRKGLNQG